MNRPVLTRDPVTRPVPIMAPPQLSANLKPPQLQELMTGIATAVLLASQGAVSTLLLMA